MAKLTGIIQFEGTLDGYTAYKLNGKLVIRRKGYVPRSRVMNDASYARRRETMSEFGAAAALGKTIRHAWAPFKKQFQGPGASTTSNCRDDFEGLLPPVKAKVHDFSQS